MLWWDGRHKAAHFITIKLLFNRHGQGTLCNWFYYLVRFPDTLWQRWKVRLKSCNHCRVQLKFKPNLLSLKCCCYPFLAHWSLSYRKGSWVRGRGRENHEWNSEAIDFWTPWSSWCMWVGMCVIRLETPFLDIGDPGPIKEAHHVMPAALRHSCPPCFSSRCASKSPSSISL